METTMQRSKACEQEIGTGDGKMDTSFEKQQINILTKGMVKTVDESAGTLMVSLDLVYATTKVLLQQLDSNTGNSGENSSTAVRKLQESKQTAQQMIVMLEDQVLRQKEAIVSSLSRLLHFLIDDIEGTSKTTAHHLLLDNYKCSNVSESIHEEHHLKALLNENDQLRHNLSKVQIYNKVLLEREQSFLQERKSNDKKIQSTEDRMNSVERENEEMRRTIAILEHRIIKQNETIKEKGDESNLLNKQTQDLQIEQSEKIQAHKREIAHLQEEKTSFLHQIDELNNIKEKLQTDSEICQLTRQNEVKHLSKQNVKTEKELNMMKIKRRMPIQLYCQNRTRLISKVEDELTELLKRKMESEKLELDILQCAKTSDILEEIPLLVMCITVSSLETDVANTVQGLALRGKTALLIFHHRDVHALPNQASDRLLTGPLLRTVGGVYDLAFLADKGIYNCEMNNNNAVSLVNFINREGTKI